MICKRKYITSSDKIILTKLRFTNFSRRGKFEFATPPVDWYNHPWYVPWNEQDPFHLNLRLNFHIWCNVQENVLWKSIRLTPWISAGISVHSISKGLCATCSSIQSDIFHQGIRIAPSAVNTFGKWFGDDVPRSAFQSHAIYMKGNYIWSKMFHVQYQSRRWIFNKNTFLYSILHKSIMQCKQLYIHNKHIKIPTMDIHLKYSGTLSKN